MKTVLATGCFDLLHVGHVMHLEWAKAQGDVLVVALTSDDQVRKEKGEKRPVFSWHRRAYFLEHLNCVDKVVPYTGDMSELLAYVMPSVMVKGEDWRNTFPPEHRELLERMNVDLIFSPTPKLSSSDYLSGRYA